MLSSHREVGDTVVGGVFTYQEEYSGGGLVFLARDSPDSSAPSLTYQIAFDMMATSRKWAALFVDGDDPPSCILSFYRNGPPRLRLAVGIMAAIRR